MTKEELKTKVAKQQSIIDDANNQIYSDVNEYIKVFHTRLATKLAVPDVMFVGLKALFQTEVTVAIMARLM